jgi:hypothetical protein
VVTLTCNRCPRCGAPPLPTLISAQDFFCRECLTQFHVGAISITAKVLGAYTRFTRMEVVTLAL